MSHGFWDALPRPFSVLAPMADVTDVPFRTIVARCGRPDAFYTEFVSAHGLNSDGRERLIRDLAIGEHDHPIVAQFFGTVPEHLEAAGRLAYELGFDGVDINMGCPDRAIVKQGAGAALIKQPTLAHELIVALRQGAAGLPVSVKTRLGLYATDEMDAWIPALLEAKPDALIIHGRTMKEMSKVLAHWDRIGIVARWCHDADVLCVGNGDIVSRAQGETLAREHGVDGYMVGRGIFQDPWLFGIDAEHEHTRSERLKLLIDHVTLWEAQWNGIKSFDLMKKFFKMYVSGWPPGEGSRRGTSAGIASGAHDLRAKLMATKSADEVRALITDVHGVSGSASARV